MASLVHAVAPKLPMLVTLGALGSIAAAAAPVAWHLGGWSAAMPEQPVAAAAADPAEPEPVRIDPILDLAPFGVVEAPAAPDTPISETTLDLVLHGVVVQADPTASMAFIGHEGRSQGYRPDDMIADRARLVEVASDHVVLEVEGELQTLSFPEPGNAAPLAEMGAATSGPDRLRELVAAQTQGGEAESTPQDEGPQSTQDHIQLWRDRIRANPQEVLDAIGLIPTENGYRIAEQHDSGVGLAGLRAGDVVTSVNGQAVGDVEQDRTLFDNVAASGLARVEVQRDGRTIVMSFPLQ
jgi:general secretion pathway protein C